MGASTLADRIGLLVGVPTNFDDFVERAATSDYLSKLKPAADCEDRRQALKAAWDDNYGLMVALPIVDLVDKACQLEVKVFPRATLDDVRSASERCCILIALTHWKGSEILFEDISPDCTKDAISERAKLHHGRLASWLIERTDGNKGRRGWSVFRRNEPSSITKLLRDAVDLGWEAEPEDDIVDGHEALPITLSARRRTEIDEMLDGLIRPGNRIELFDGLHSKEAFEAAISPTFQGLLDLTTCTSTILADHVSRTRAATLRLVQFPEQQEFLWHTQCLATALELTIHHGVPYPKARLMAESSLKKALAEITGTDAPGTPT